jgi:hypothetical protein
MENDYIKECVRQALKNANENGYDFEGWTNEEIALDMIDYDEALENANVEVVTRCIAEILAE